MSLALLLSPPSKQKENLECDTLGIAGKCPMLPGEPSMNQAPPHHRGQSVWHVQTNRRKRLGKYLDGRVLPWTVIEGCSPEHPTSGEVPQLPRILLTKSFVRCA